MCFRRRVDVAGPGVQLLRVPDWVPADRVLLRLPDNLVAEWPALPARMLGHPGGQLPEQEQSNLGNDPQQRT